jgi:transcription initiation factor IIF auxiliary subunit
LRCKNATDLADWQKENDSHGFPKSLTGNDLATMLESWRETSARSLHYLNLILASVTIRKQTSIYPRRNTSMSNAAHSTENVIVDTPSELIDLQKVIEALPAAQRLAIQPAFQRVVESTNRRRKILQLVQDSIGQLRLDMKYLVFDLEATRRERDAYQAQIAELTGEGGENEGNLQDDGQE